MEQQQDQAVTVMANEANSTITWANSLSVTNQTEANAAMQNLAVIKGMRKKVADFFAPMKSAAAAAHKAIVARENEIVSVADRAEQIVKGKVMAWQTAERLKAEAEQRRLQAEADEAARKAREKLEKEAAKLKTPELREARLEAAASVVAPVVTVAAPVASAAGTSVRKTWRAVLVSKDLLANAGTATAASLLVFDQRAADAFARATKGSVPVPGVRFEEIESLSVRAI